jgi:hypothetical protein
MCHLQKQASALVLFQFDLHIPITNFFLSSIKLYFYHHLMKLRSFHFHLYSETLLPIYAYAPIYNLIVFHFDPLSIQLFPNLLLQKVIIFHHHIIRDKLFHDDVVFAPLNLSIHPLFLSNIVRMYLNFLKQTTSTSY